MRARIILLLLLVALAAITLDKTVIRAAINSPLSTPAAFISSPLSTPQPSIAAQKVISYIAERDAIPLKALEVAADFPVEHPARQRRFRAISLVDNRPEGRIYKFLVDLTTGQIEENIPQLRSAEFQARQKQYGKSQPSLFNKLRTLSDLDLIPVAVWVAEQPNLSETDDSQEAIFAKLAEKYPEAKTAMMASGKPMDVSNPELARRIEEEHRALAEEKTTRRIQPLKSDLESQGFVVNTYPGIPTLAAVLPKRTILQLLQRQDVVIVFLTEDTAHPSLDSAVPTSRIPLVWARGYTGTGQIIAILENGNVDLSNTFLHHGVISRTSSNGFPPHTTIVASAAASFHNIYRGVAPGATILSAGHDGSQTDAVAALSWAFDQGAHIVNLSEYWEIDNDLNWIDYAFDHWARERFRLITVAPSNSSGMLGSPGKAWNVITVGSTNDNNTPDWIDDKMANTSPYVNPGAAGDREKPEVVAVGDNIQALTNTNNLGQGSGTSLAAPQLAGLAALLTNRNQSLQYWPESIKAINMASATHNITGPVTIVAGQGDLRDGAGAINAELADNIAQVHAQSDTTCFTSCWWGEYITATFPVNTELERSFYVDKGDVIRIVITWWANADGVNYGYELLDTDLDLRVKFLDQYLSGVYSLSHDNNYEMVQFVAPASGTYKIAVRKYRADEPSNYLGMALAIVRNRSYLPVVLKVYPTPTTCGFDGC